MSDNFRPTFPHQFPAFECRKQFWALRVKKKVPTETGYDLHFEDKRFPVLSVGRDLAWPYMFFNNKELSMGYIVRFEPDGDLFFLDGDIFDALVEPDARVKGGV